ncbi:M48 family metallopeptidase [Leptotrichia sp. oral taxon 847]|uniref:M48 family metallopeptidase n=1 Tax=Leptotrichia sp. oral taxon 847 TaxID=1785996 RepID=UPI00076807FF|nr:SprT family zinc-dependent metalloprotease [Leptotrichia sp. oral taxon 847]AMD95591.1 zinc metalloprotease [Leptotrichia sp. oral taxon 847]
MKTEKILGYEVHRKKVKNINLRIKPNMEIYISAPENLHSDYIKNFLISKENWIKNVLKKLEKIKEEQKEPKYTTGETHKFLGQKYILTVKIGNVNRVALNNDKKNEIILMVNSSIFNNSDEKKKILEKWYFENAKKIFPKLLEKWIKILNEDVKKFSIKPLNKKWGFCNYIKKYVTLNVELIKHTPFEIEYVILHELAHLKYPNHAKGFYNYVEKYMPNYKNAEKMLNAKHHY